MHTKNSIVLFLCLFFSISLLFVSCTTVDRTDAFKIEESSGNLYITKGIRKIAVLHLDNGSLKDDVSEYITLMNDEGFDAALPNIKVIKEGKTFDKWKETSISSLYDKEYKVEWEKNSYPISYDKDGIVYVNRLDAANTVIKEKKVKPENPVSYTSDDETFTLLPAERYGYDFIGWIEKGEDADKAREYTIKKGSKGAKSLVAVWTPKQFSIDYDLDGGSFENVPISSFTFGSDSISIENPVREFYDFVGWIDSEKSDPVMNYYVDMTNEGNVSLKAIWKPVEYNISYDFDGGILAGSKNPDTYNVETEDFTLKIPAKKGYSFGGWAVEFADGTYGPEYILNLSNDGHEMILEVYSDHAIFKYPEIVSASDIEDLLYDFAFTYGSSVSAYNAEISDGVCMIDYPEGQETYIIEYFKNSNLVMDTITIPSGSWGDRSYKATWNAVSYSLSYDKKGIIKREKAPSNPDYYTIYDEFTLINPEREGYKFIGWINEGDDASAAVKDYTISKGLTGDKYMIPVWEEDSFSITYETNGADMNEDWPSSFTYEEGYLQISDPIKEGYIFAGWLDGSSETPEKNYIISSFDASDLHLEAVWRPEVYSISYDLNGGNLPDYEENPLSYTIEDDDFGLCSPARKGYEFEGWREKGKKDVYDVNYCVNTDDARNLELEAIWKPIEYTISYDVDGGYYKYEIENPSSYNIETEDTLIANPYKDGYKFRGWIVAGDRSETLYPNYRIKKGSSGNLKLFAVYDIEKYPVGKITEMQIAAPEAGKNGIPRPDWVISAPDDYMGIHFEKAYANEGDFNSSYAAAVKKAQIQIANYYGSYISYTDKVVNDTVYIAKSIETKKNLYGTSVIEYWEDSSEGIWVLLAAMED